MISCQKVTALFEQQQAAFLASIAEAVTSEENKAALLAKTQQLQAENQSMLIDLVEDTSKRAKTGASDTSSEGEALQAAVAKSKVEAAPKAKK